MRPSRPSPSVGLLSLLGMISLGWGCAGPGPDPDPPKSAAVRAINDRQYEDAALSVIDQATGRVEVIQFQLLRGAAIDRLVEALGRARGRGVAVQVLLDEEVAESAEAIGRLSALGIDARLDSPRVRTHTKMVLADRRRLLFGSTNWSNTSVRYNHESNLLIEDEELGAAAGAYFTALFTRPDQPAPSTVTEREGLSLYPDRAFEAPLIQILGEARTRLDVQMYAARVYPDDPSSPSTRALDALRAAQRRGVAVRVILDWSDFNDEGNQINQETARYLMAGGVAVRYDRTQVISHAELVVTEAAATVGSMNWGFGGFRLYHAKLNGVVREAGVRALLGTYFDALWAEARPAEP